MTPSFPCVAAYLIPPVTELWAISRSSVTDLLLQELEKAEIQAPDPPTSANDWATRNEMAAERWKEARPQLLQSALALEAIEDLPCGNCHIKKAVVECKECLPYSLICENCYCEVHHLRSLRNRRSLISGFYKPIPPGVVVQVVNNNGMFISYIYLSHHLCGTLFMYLSHP